LAAHTLGPLASVINPSAEHVQRLTQVQWTAGGSELATFDHVTIHSCSLRWTSRRT